MCDNFAVIGPGSRSIHYRPMASTTTAPRDLAGPDNDRPAGSGTAGVLLAENSSLVGRPHSLIDRLTPHDRERVRSIGTVRQLNRSDILLSQGEFQDGIVMVDSGLIRSFYTAPSGREITLAYWFSGNLVGGPQSSAGRACGPRSRRASRVFCLPGEGLCDLAREVPDLALSSRRPVVQGALLFVARADARHAIPVAAVGARAYVFDGDVRHPRANGQIAVAAAFSHAEMANLIGATRQWVTISLNRLEKRCIISQKRGIMVVCKLDVLRKLTGRRALIVSAQ